MEPKRKPPVVPILAIVAVLFILYLAAYFAVTELVVLTGPTGNIYIRRYRVGGHAIQALFYPVYVIDRRLRDVMEGHVRMQARQQPAG